MNTAKTIIILTIIGLFSCKNENSYKPFQPATLGYIKSIKYDCLSVDTLEETTNPFKSIWECTYYDSIYNALSKKYSDKRDYNGMNSIDSLRFSEKINGVLKYQILRRDSTKAMKAVVYEDFTLDGDFCTGYWVALSKDTGVSWKYYYTGVTKTNFYYFKPKSTIPLFVNDSVIQIESAIVRKVKQEILPVGSPEYELLKDGLIVSINLNKLCLDSDNDGLTDIEEKKMMTNLYKADTDGDGIIDGQDNNPRFRNIDSDFSTLFRFLLEGEMGRSDSYLLPFSDSTKTYKSMYNEKQVYMVVSEDSKIINISRTINTYIFISKSELQSYLRSIPVTPRQRGIEIKRVGIFTEEYKICLSELTWSGDYIVRKTKTGWKIKIESTTQI
jgi:hypothetical protein